MTAVRQRTVADMIGRGRIVQLPGTASVREASFLMARERVGAVLVTGTDGRLDGIFTERDALNRLLAKHLDADSTSLHEVMTASPTTVSPDSLAIDALRLMREGGFRHLPVVARGVAHGRAQEGRVVGVISLRDFVGAELAAIEDEFDFRVHFAEGPHRQP